MTKLLRPHIPLKVRVIVAVRQVDAAGVTLMQIPGETAKARLDRHLRFLFGKATPHLDHDPALENRERIYTSLDEHIGYKPAPNDPDYLVYREKAAHDIKTRVRGEHGQFADNVIAKRERRRKKKAAAAKGVRPLKRRVGFGTKSKASWPKGRKLQSRNTLRRSP